jgi:hypothetical protein
LETRPQHYVLPRREQNDQHHDQFRYDVASEFATTCKTRLISDEIDRALQKAWDYTNSPNGDPSVFVTETKSKLGWYYKVCTDHDRNWFADEDFKSFLNVAASLTSINMAVDDPANESTYKARAAQYEKWREALYEAESKKGWARRIWERITAPH